MARQARAVQTRAAALDAAISLLTDEGYTALTTRAVQHLSDLSRGALLHHFPTREDLLAATVEELIERRARHAQEIIDQFNVDPPADRLTAAIRTVRELFSGPDFLAEMELWSASRTNPVLRETLVPVSGHIAERLRGQLIEIFGAEIAARPDFSRLSMLTVEVARGLAFSAPLRRGRGDAVLLDYWCQAAAALLDQQPAT